MLSLTIIIAIIIIIIIIIITIIVITAPETGSQDSDAGSGAKYSPRSPEGAYTHIHTDGYTYIHRWVSLVHRNIFEV